MEAGREGEGRRVRLTKVRAILDPAVKQKELARRVRRPASAVYQPYVLYAVRLSG